MSANRIAEFEIIEFRSEYQGAAADLVNLGLGEHFGHVDKKMNPDLFDIGLSYVEGVFLLALSGNQVVGTGSLMPLGDGVGQIARMHTASKYRRQGLASRLLRKLEKQAEARDFHTVVLETNIDWFDAITFYLRNGYSEMARNEFGIRFQKSLHTSRS